MKTYTFGEQLRVGQAGEDAIDSILSRYGSIIHATDEQQRAGIDRILHSGRVGRTMEYKTDVRAASTGNLFLETVANVGKGKPGWVYSCTAELIVFFLPSLQWVVVVETRRLREAAREWERTAKTRFCQNPTYQSKGILVPIEEVVLLAKYIDYIPEKWGDT